MINALTQPEGVAEELKSPQIKDITSFSKDEIISLQELAQKYENKEKNTSPRNPKLEWNNTQEELDDQKNMETINTFLNKYNNLSAQDKATIDNAYYPELQILINDLNRIVHPYVMAPKNKEMKTGITTETGIEDKIDEGKKIEQ